jgi:hypothetical protein
LIPTSAAPRLVVERMPVTPDTSRSAISTGQVISASQIARA